MKKLLIFALTAVFALSLSSCGKNKKADGTTEEQQKTKTELLCIEKGWVLSAATSSPAYELADGTFAINLMTDGYLYPYELDDIIIFNSNGNQVINGGTNVPADPYEDYQQRDYGVGTWSFSDDETVLYFQIPFFYNEMKENAQVLALTENELRVKYTFNDDEAPAKGTYSFTLTYVPVK